MNTVWRKNDSVKRAACFFIWDAMVPSLIFMIDFVRPIHHTHSLYDEAIKRFEPLKGKIYRQTVRVTKRLLEIVAILGGQWPHSSFMVPGGVVFGLIEAPRGALGHWVKIKNGHIEKYQIITPSSWNASPRDANNLRGPWEEALIGTHVADIQNPIEVDTIIRSFDPCLVCAVHVIS